MCSCISTLSSAIYSFLEVKEISPTPSLPTLSRHLWAPWSSFSSWTMRSSALSPVSFYRWSNLLLNFTLSFAETKLSCESLCVCLRAGHNSIGETDREKQGEYCMSAISSGELAGTGHPAHFTYSGCPECYMHCRCDLRAGLDNYLHLLHPFLIYIFSPLQNPVVNPICKKATEANRNEDTWRHLYIGRDITPIQSMNCVKNLCFQIRVNWLQWREYQWYSS